MNSTELRLIRAQLGLSQAALAESLGYAPNHIARLEMPSNQGRFKITRRMEAQIHRLLNERRKDPLTTEAT